jgi:hypothetical protein
MSVAAPRPVGLLAAIVLLAGSVGLMSSGLYGLTIFLLVPMLAGALANLVFPRASAGGAAGSGLLTAGLGLGLFLLLGFDGLICIVMAAPIALPLGALGGLCGYMIARRFVSAHNLMALALLPPASVLHDVNATSPVFEVRTSLEINAPPHAVWKHVVTFAQLPEPQEWYFRTGIAYPKRARIEGSGVGAVRYCEFSTGAFVEPITMWDEARLLAFRVTENPPPMHEWSPYAKVAPKHLDGYMVSERGQFRLTPLEGGRTLLEGTTWYRHGLWPAQYWRWWSDAIIHRIHLRVLRHVRDLAESRQRT